MLDFLSSKNEQVGFGWFYKETAVFSAISYIGLILIYYLVEAFGDEALLVAVLFTLISVSSRVDVSTFNSLSNLSLCVFDIKVSIR